MYYPYFRGKQYELITIRECAPIFEERKFVPIIEPVKELLKPLEKTLEVVCAVGTKIIVIINPQLGDHKSNGEGINALLNGKKFASSKNIIKGLLLTEELPAESVNALLREHENGEVALVHAGFSQAKQLASLIAGQNNITTSIFLEKPCGKLYRKHFDSHQKKILIRDGFTPRRGRDHPDVEAFSDLHVTFGMEGANGFGDFLIVGDEYSETGGPAYTVTIHITFIDQEKDDEMHIYHFKSVRQDTPKDPAGKFAEALNKLITELEKPNNKIEETSAIIEFRSLHSTGHFPGLGYVKKLSMKHHIETLARYFQKVGTSAT